MQFFKDIVVKKIVLRFDFYDVYGMYDGDFWCYGEQESGVIFWVVFRYVENYGYVGGFLNFVIVGGGDIEFIFLNKFGLDGKVYVDCCDYEFV